MYSEEPGDLYSSPDIIWVMKSNRTRWVGHMAHKGRGEVHTEFWWGNLRDRDHLEGVDGRIILKWILKTWEEGHGLA
jgi:hypothetical protein